MNDILFLLANSSPLECLIDGLERDVLSYKHDPSEENKKKMVISCMLITAKESIDTNGGIDKTIAMSHQAKKGYELLNVVKN